MTGDGPFRHLSAQLNILEQMRVFQSPLLGEHVRTQLAGRLGIASALQEHIAAAIQPLQGVSAQLAATFGELYQDQFSPLTLVSQRLSEAARLALPGPFFSTQWATTHYNVVTALSDALGGEFSLLTRQLSAAASMQSVMTQIACTLTIPGVGAAFSRAYSPLLIEQLSFSASILAANSSLAIGESLRELLEEVERTQDTDVDDDEAFGRFVAALIQYVKKVGAVLGRQTVLAWIGLLFALYVYVADQRRDAIEDDRFEYMSQATAANATAIETLIALVHDLPSQENSLVITRRARVRAGPSLSAQIVDRLNAGDVVEQIEVLDGWIMISYPSVLREERLTGWVNASLVRTAGGEHD